MWQVKLTLIAVSGILPVGLWPAMRVEGKSRWSAQIESECKPLRITWRIPHRNSNAKRMRILMGAISSRRFTEERKVVHAKECLPILRSHLGLNGDATRDLQPPISLVRKGRSNGLQEKTPSNLSLQASRYMSNEEE